MIAPARAWAKPAAIVRPGAAPLNLTFGNQAKWITAAVTLPKARAAAARGLRWMMRLKDFIARRAVSFQAQSHYCLSGSGLWSKGACYFLVQDRRPTPLSGVRSWRREARNAISTQRGEAQRDRPPDYPGHRMSSYRRIVLSGTAVLSCPLAR